MKIKFLVILGLLFIIGVPDSFSQSKSLLVEVEKGYNFDFGKNKILFDDGYFEVINENGKSERITVYGKKLIQTSSNQEFLLLLNYQFGSELENGRINFYKLNKNSELVREEGDILYHGFPHKLYSINNNGVIVSFDPLTLEVEILIESQDRVKIKLSESYEWDRETQYYLKTDNENIYLAVNNTNPGKIKSKDGKVDLFIINIEEKTIVTKNLPISIATCFEIFEGAFCVSGKVESNGTYFNKTMFFNSGLEILKETDIAINKRILKYKSNYLAAGTHSYYMLNSNFDIVNEYRYPENSVFQDILILDDEVYSIISKGEKMLINLFLNEKKVFDFNSASAILNFGSFDSLIKLKCFYLYNSKQTYKIRNH